MESNVNKQKINEDIERDNKIKFYKREVYGMTQNKMLQPGTKKYREGKNWQEIEMRRLWDDRRNWSLIHSPL
jgi:hypothetical protein